MPTTRTYTDNYVTTPDGLRMHYRDYAGDDPRAPVLCIPGLTRNARDFGALPDLLGSERRFLLVNLRGRGGSDYASDAGSYHPGQYVADIIAMLDALALPKAVFIGTSLGGIVTMFAARKNADRIAGAALNDIGPELEAAGVTRIAGQVGQSKSYDTWVHAARAVADTQKEIYPDFALTDWIAFTKKLYRLKSNGRIMLDYDSKIAEAFQRTSEGDGGAAALWQGVDALANKPVLLLRGALSDLFSDASAQAMLARLPQGELVTIDRVGHAPTLEEPESVAGLQRLLAACD
jgi:pimeloyl-ACP methyl ester carboxylesterase